MAAQFYDSRMTAFQATGTRLGMQAMPPDTAATALPDWFVSALGPPAALAASSDYVHVPLMATSVCFAYNRTDVRQLRVDFLEFGAFLMGTSTNITITPRRASSPLFSPSMQLVLASDSPNTRLLFASLDQAGVAGFNGSATPAAVAANPSVQWVATDDDVATALATTNRWGLVPLINAFPLPCAEITVVDSSTAEEGSFYNDLTQTQGICPFTKVDVAAATLTVSGLVFPLQPNTGTHEMPVGPYSYVGVRTRCPNQVVID